MNAINATAKGLTIHRRRNTRHWGAAQAPTQPSAGMVRRIISWEAFVVDASTHERIDGYPAITGDDGVDFDGDKDVAYVREQYLLRCKHHDQKPNVQVLKDHLSIGDWEITAVVKDAVSVS